MKAEVRLYDRLFSVPSPGKEHEDGNFLRDLNPESIKIITDALIEPSLVRLKPGEVLQFERLGYFVVDRVDNKAGDAANGIPVKFNRVVTLKVVVCSLFLLLILLFCTITNATIIRILGPTRNPMNPFRKSQRLKLCKKKTRHQVYRQVQRC